MSNHESLPLAGPDGVLQLRPSYIKVWSECPRHFKATAVERMSGGSIYTALGTAAHAVIEMLNRGESLAPTERRALVAGTFAAECKAEGIYPERPAGYTAVLDAVAAYALPDDWIFLEGEDRRTVAWPGFRLSYTPDAIVESLEDDWIRIVDFKTSAKPPKDPLQMRIYAVAELRRVPGRFNPARLAGTFMIVRGDLPRFEHRFTEAELVATEAWLVDQAAAIATAIAEDDFPTRPSRDNCRFCPLSDCPERVSGKY